MKQIKNVTIIGAGTMGHSLALAFIQHGHEVRLHDIRENSLSQARALIASGLHTLTEMNLPTSGDEDSCLRRLHTTSNLEEAAKNADFVIEAIVEDKSAKQELFAALDRICPPHAILASNTSYLNIFDFVQTSRPGNIIITHWFNPPHIIPLVEIVRGPQTGQHTVDQVTQLLHGMGKQTIIMSKFLPGFIVNRLQSALRNEALYLLDNGYCTPEQIDLATKTSFGLRTPLTGVAQRMDFAGLDVTQKVLLNPELKFAPQIRQSKSLDDQIAQGRLGVKNGKGYYDYQGKSAAEIMRDSDMKLIKLIQFLTESGVL